MSDWFDNIAESAKHGNVRKSKEQNEVRKEIDILAKRIKKSGISIRAFSRSSGLNHSTIQQWLIGDITPTIENWKKAKAQLESFSKKKAENK